jgi:RNA polymerase sigma factor (TIGR02999 family)
MWRCKTVQFAARFQHSPLKRDLGVSHCGKGLLCYPGKVSDVTQILEAIENGDAKAADELLPLVYQELRRLAAHKMANEAPGHTLQPTALVHEAWLRLLRPDEQARFQNRAHFFGAAAEAMRRILIESARRKKRLKHGGQLERVDVGAIELPSPMPDDELLALDEALDRLAIVDARAAEVVKLCFFVGLTQDQAARELGISSATARRLWSFARAWLLREIERYRDPAA